MSHTLVADQSQSLTGLSRVELVKTSTLTRCQRRLMNVESSRRQHSVETSRCQYHQSPGDQSTKTPASRHSELSLHRWHLPPSSYCSRVTAIFPGKPGSASFCRGPPPPPVPRDVVLETAVLSRDRLRPEFCGLGLGTCGLGLVESFSAVFLGCFGDRSRICQHVCIVKLWSFLHIFSH